MGSRTATSPTDRSAERSDKGRSQFVVMMKWDDETMAEAEAHHVAQHGPFPPHRLRVIIRKFRDDGDNDDPAP